MTTAPPKTRYVLQQAEAEHPGIADRAGGLAVEARAESLRGILDNGILFPDRL